MLFIDKEGKIAFTNQSFRKGFEIPHLKGRYYKDIFMGEMLNLVDQCYVFERPLSSVVKIQSRYYQVESSPVFSDKEHLIFDGTINLKSIIGPAFYDVHKHIKNNDFTHYWLKGGRGSLKSSCIGTEIPLGIMRDAKKGLMSNAVVIRRVKDTLRGSVYEQIKWAIYMLKAENDWEIPDSKLQMTYKPTGQVIIFKGADNPKKLKSTKVFIGYIKYVWYEECDELIN